MRGIDQGDLPAPDPVADEDEDLPRRSSAGLLIIVVLLGLLVIGGGAAGVIWWQGGFTTYVMDKAAVEEGVNSVLTDPEEGFNLGGVSSVTCPAEQEVIVNARFACTATVEGTDRSVQVTILNEDGDYEVGQPE